MDAFDPNDYRKRVLAAVERRGGLEFSDSFELYDIPLEEAESLDDVQVGARVEEVWGFWQRQRDHPKYRVLVGLLVDSHERRSELLLRASSRRAEAMRVRQEREQRDAERYEMLDTAIGRLVQRHGGVPASKVAGLEEIGAMGGLSAAEVAGRLRRHRILEQETARPEPVAQAVTVTEQRRKQIAQLLGEWARLLDGQPTPTLFALLGLDPTAASRTEEIRLRAEALRARSRELPPGRVRVVLDELLVHVQDLLAGGGPAAEEYVRAVIEDVTAELRPKVRAAVLVEDELVGEDYQFLLEEAMELGLDRARAVQVLTELTTALGARIETPSVAPPPPSGGGYTPHYDPRPVATPARGWEEPLKAARAALRAGRPQEAARQVAQARQLDNGAGATQIRSIADEVERVLAEAVTRWRNVGSARAGKRYVEMLDHLEYLRRSAADVPPPTGHTDLDELLAEAARAIEEADRQVAAADTAPPAQRTRALLAAQRVCADHEGVCAALAATPVEPPTRVATTRLPNGSVQVSWSPSATQDATYRVTRLQPDGSWRVVGRTHTTELEDGGAPTGEIPVYAVAAAVAGRYSDPARSDAPAAPMPPPTGGAAPTAVHPTAAPSSASPRPAASDVTASGSAASGAHSAAPVTEATAAHSATGDHASPRDEPNPGGIPTVSALGEQGGLLVFTWPAGVTEVYVVARADAPPSAPDDPAARAWKVTNMRYEIDGGVKMPAELARPCHVAVASCRREPNGTLTVAPGFAATARLHWVV